MRSQPLPQASIEAQAVFPRKPLIAATAAALLSLAAGQAQATCDVTVSTPQTSAETFSGCGNLTVNSGGAIDVSGGTYAVGTSGEWNPTITNYGRITHDAVAIDLNLSPGIAVINNYGTIAAPMAVQLSAGTATINNYAGGQIAGGIVATNLMNEGTVTLKSGVDLNDIANTGSSATAILSGSYTGEASSTLRVAIVNASGEGDYSYLQASSVTLNGGTLDVDVKAGSGLTAGQSFHVVRATSYMSGRFAAITDNSAMFNFTQRVVEGSSIPGLGVYLDAQRVLTALQAATNTGNNPGRGAASVLDSGAPGLDEVVGRLGQLSTEQEVSDAVSQTVPLLTGSASAAMGSARHGTGRVIQSRQDGQHGRSTGDEFYGNKKLWFKPFGSWADQDRRKGVDGFESDTFGMVFGADAEVGDANRLGVAFSYARSDIDGKSRAAPNRADVDSYQFVVYGSRSLSDSTDLSFQADVGRHDTEGRRSILFMNQVAKSDYNSWSAHLGAGLAHTLSLSEKTSFTPSVRADYTWMRDESYRETGAGALNLDVDSNRTEELIFGVDGKLTHKMNDKATVTANLGAGYDVINEQSSITAAFAGAPGAAFTTKGLDPSPWHVRGGLGVVGNVSQTVEVTARYDFEVKQDFDNQTASFKLRWAF